MAALCIAGGTAITRFGDVTNNGGSVSDGAKAALDPKRVALDLTIAGAVPYASAAISKGADWAANKLLTTYVDREVTQIADQAATKAVNDVFRYTKGEFVDSISTNGLRPGSYATPNGGLSPLQAQIDLALPPNTGLRDAVMRVDVAGLRQSGYEIPAISRVTGTVTGPGGRVYTMPGGGYEMQFPYAIPPEFIKVVTP